MEIYKTNKNMDIKIFIKKNLKTITLVIFLLLMLKTFQSCNRDMKINKLTKQNTYLVDSLNTMHGSEKTTLMLDLRKAQDSIQMLNYEIKIAIANMKSADRRANAVQSTAEKIRKNTTIKIENRSETDSVSINSRR